MTTVIKRLRTTVGDIDWRFDNVSGSHLQSQVDYIIYRVKWIIYRQQTDGIYVSGDWPDWPVKPWYYLLFSGINPSIVSLMMRSYKHRNMFRVNIFKRNTFSPIILVIRRPYQTRFKPGSLIYMALRKTHKIFFLSFFFWLETRHSWKAALVGIVVFYIRIKDILCFVIIMVILMNFKGVEINELNWIEIILLVAKNVALACCCLNSLVKPFGHSLPLRSWSPCLTCFAWWGQFHISCYCRAELTRPYRDLVSNALPIPVPKWIENYKYI